MKSDTDVLDREVLDAVASRLDVLIEQLAGQRKGFALFVFDFGAQGNTQYASNCNRNDMIAALRELLGKWATDGSVTN